MNDTATQANQAAMRAAVATRHDSRDAAPAQGTYCPWRISKSPRAASCRGRSSATSRAAWRRTRRCAATAPRSRSCTSCRACSSTPAARHQKTTLFGRTYDLPFGFPPMGGTSLAAYEGDTVLAKVAAELNTADDPERRVARRRWSSVKAVGPTAWFQAYLPGRPDDHHAARRARAARGLRDARADGGRAGGRQPREQRAQRLQLAAQADAAARVGLRDPAALALRHVPAARS